MLSTPGHNFFRREQLLEQRRLLGRSLGYPVPSVSRLHCTFAFEDRDVAENHEAQGHNREHLYQVEPVDPLAAAARLDALWLTWLGEEGRTAEQAASQCDAYWMGRSTADHLSTATPVWEWLFGCALRVLEVFR